MYMILNSFSWFKSDCKHYLIHIWLFIYLYSFKKYNFYSHLFYLKHLEKNRLNLKKEMLKYIKNLSLIDITENHHLKFNKNLTFIASSIKNNSIKNKFY